MAKEWCVWGPEIHGGRMVVDSELSKKDALAGAERRNAAAKRHGARGGYQAAEEGASPPEPEEPLDRYEVRKDPELAYQAFMSMGQEEWWGLVKSLLNGGVLQPGEKEGFDRALEARSQKS